MNKSPANILALCAATALLPVTQVLAADKTYGVEISPNGKHYAVLRDVGEQRAFAIYEVDNGAAPKAIGLGATEIEDFEWGGDDYILVRVKGEKGGIDLTTGLATLSVARWLSISRETGKSQTHFGNEQGSGYFYFITSAGALLASLPQDNENALFARTSIEIKPGGPSRIKEGDDEQLYSLQRANLRTGKAVVMREGQRDTIDWIVDGGGRVLARVDQQQASKKIEIMATSEDGKNGKSAGMISGDDVKAQSMTFLGAGVGGRSIQVMKNAGGALALYEYSLDGAGFGAPVAAPGPLTRAVYDPREARARIVYYSGAAGERPFHLDADDQKTQGSLEKALSGASISIVSKSVDGARLIARAEYADKPEEYYFFDKSAKRLELVAAN